MTKGTDEWNVLLLKAIMSVRLSCPCLKLVIHVTSDPRHFGTGAERHWCRSVHKTNCQTAELSGHIGASAEVSN